MNSRPIRDIHGKSVRLAKKDASHVRKKAPIEMPFVVEQTDTDGAGREMPFIVGKVTPMCICISCENCIFMVSDFGIYEEHWKVIFCDS